MVKRVLLRRWIGFTLLVGMAVALQLSVARAQQCKLITINMENTGGVKSVLQLVPQTVIVPKGTCVVWINWVSRADVRINFQKSSKSCMLATGSPAGFRMIKGCYISGYLPLGKTASLYFKKPGVFRYRLEARNAQTGYRAGPAKYTTVGTIEVK